MRHCEPISPHGVSWTDVAVAGLCTDRIGDTIRRRAEVSGGGR
jgi:hypothetical protein